MSALIPGFGPHPWVMGILNVTPDSFSDGGRWADTEAAVRRGHELVRLGADLVDIGGESTRPGAHRIEAGEEIDRVVPVVTELAAAGIKCSVDTTRSEVAVAAVMAGAVVVNDVSGGLADPEMALAVADLQVPWILMHWRGHSLHMGSLTHYDGPVEQVVRSELFARVDAAIAAGVAETSLILDPGLGFAKESWHNWELLRHLNLLTDSGFPVLVGASRKRFLSDALTRRTTGRISRARRDALTAEVSRLSADCGAWGVRVHEPAPTLDVFQFQQELRISGGPQHEPRLTNCLPEFPDPFTGHMRRPLKWPESTERG